MNNMEEEKIFYMPGDVVTLKQDIPNKPTMIVMKKETCKIRDKSFGNIKEESLRGIRCMWFTSDGTFQEAIFNTKDLIKL